MLYAIGCISKKMYRDVASSINFDVIHRFGSVVCLWSYSKWSISSSTKFHGCSFIWCTTRSILYLSKQSTKPIGRIQSCSICHLLMTFIHDSTKILIWILNMSMGYASKKWSLVLVFFSFVYFGKVEDLHIYAYKYKYKIKWMYKFISVFRLGWFHTYSAYIYNL